MKLPIQNIRIIPEMVSPTVLEAGNLKSRCDQELCLLEGAGEEPVPHLFSLSSWFTSYPWSPLPGNGIAPFSVFCFSLACVSSLLIRTQVILDRDPP